MKKLFKAALLVTFISLAPAAFANDVVVKPNLINSTSTMDAIEAQKLINRLEEIKAMDKSSLTRSQKKELKKEVRAIQKKMDSSGGVYLSVGAVILIIVLLIILL